MSEQPRKKAPNPNANDATYEQQDIDNETREKTGKSVPKHATQEPAENKRKDE